MTGLGQTPPGARAAAHPQVRILLSLRSTIAQLYPLIGNRSLFVFTACADSRPACKIVSCRTPVRLHELNSTTRVAEPSGCRGEGPSLSRPPDLLSNEVAVCQQVGSLIRSHRSQRSTHTVKWAEVVYFFLPLSPCLQGRLSADTDTVTVPPLFYVELCPLDS